MLTSFENEDGATVGIPPRKNGLQVVVEGGLEICRVEVVEESRVVASQLVVLLQYPVGSTAVELAAAKEAD